MLNCGYLKEDLGGNEIFNCNRCKKVIDRDCKWCLKYLFWFILN